MLPASGVQAIDGYRPVGNARYGMHVVHNRRCLSKEFAFFPDWITVKMLL
jgi:hypothetical protein